MQKITSADVYYARNQPYGYWRAGNPIVKITVIILIAIGAFLKNPSLIIQSAIVVFVMLWAPFNPRSLFQIIVINFGLGLLVVSSFNPKVFPYHHVRYTTDIPYIARIEWLSITSMFIMMIAFFYITRAITSRDYAWFINIVPVKWFRQNIGGAMYAFGYGILRLRNVIVDADIAIRSRGGYRPYSICALGSLDSFIDNFSYWMIYILRELDEMKCIVQYVIASRLKISTRKTPIARKWSPTDISIIGIIAFGILIPRLPPVAKVISFILSLW